MIGSEEQQFVCFPRSEAYNMVMCRAAVNSKPARTSSSYEVVGRLDEGQPGRAGGPVDE
jgi:hypothetical protein